VNSTLAPELTVADRCDRCGAQAYMRAKLAGGFELMFCAHHGREHMDKLRDLDDIEITDETHRLHQESASESV
jgi:ribosomal protein L37E